MVQGVEVEIGQEGTDDRPLRGTIFGRLPSFATLHHPLGQELFQQPEHAPVRDLFPHAGQELRLGDAVEVSFEVRVHYPGVSFRKVPLHNGHGLPGIAAGTKTVAAFRELLLEDRLQVVQ